MRALRDQLLASENRLASARASKRESLRNVKESKQEFLSEAAGLARASASLAAQIASAQSSHSYSPPGDVDAVGLGLHLAGQRPGDERIRERWGRMHEGIDIGVGYGTPIHAAASGRVI